MTPEDSKSDKWKQITLDYVLMTPEGSKSRWITINDSKSHWITFNDTRRQETTLDHDKW